MPNIYDTEEVTLDNLSSEDSLFLLDVSDTTMSAAGSNKLVATEKVSSSANSIVSNSNFDIDYPQTGQVTIEFFKRSQLQLTEPLGEDTSFILTTSKPHTLSESQRTLISENIDNISYLRVRKSDDKQDSKARFVDPKHFEFSSLIQPISVIVSNLSSLQAYLIHLYYGDGLNFSEAYGLAKNDINAFFNDSVPAGFDLFDIESLIKAGEFSDNKVTKGSETNGRNTNHYINTNYDFLVKSAMASNPPVELQHTHFGVDFVNNEIASLIKGHSLNNNVFDNVFTTAGFLRQVIINIGGSENADTIANNSAKISTAAINDGSWQISSLYYNPITSTGANNITFSESSESNPFDEVSYFYSEAITGYIKETTSLLVDGGASGDLSVGGERSLLVDGFSETQVNQKYYYETANNERMTYLSEDDRFELVYASTGESSPTVLDITETFEYPENLTYGLGYYEVTLTGLDYGIAYSLEFDNITAPFSNGRKIYKVASDSDSDLINASGESLGSGLLEKYEFTLLTEGVNQSASFKLQTTDFLTTANPDNPPFSFSNFKSLRSQRYLDSPEDLNWVLRSTDIRTNFQGNMSASVSNPGGGWRFNVAIANTENLIFDIEAVRSLSDDWEVFEASVVGSSETITRSYLISELGGYQFFRINTYFAANKNRYYYPTDEQGVNPIGLESGWVNIDSLGQENTIIRELNAKPYLKSTTKSGLFLDFEFGNLVSGSTYNQYIPTHVNFEGDSNVYLPKLDSILTPTPERFIPNNRYAIIHADSETYNLLTAYDISGESGISLQTGSHTSLNLTGEEVNFRSLDLDIFIPSGTTLTSGSSVSTALEIGVTNSLNLTGEEIDFRSLDINLSIPSETTLTIDLNDYLLTEAGESLLQENSFKLLTFIP
jgi:hypothetical protein